MPKQRLEEPKLKLPSCSCFTVIPFNCYVSPCRYFVKILSSTGLVGWWNVSSFARPIETNITNWMGRRWSLKTKVIQILILTEIFPQVLEAWYLKTSRSIIKHNEQHDIWRAVTFLRDCTYSASSGIGDMNRNPFTLSWQHNWFKPPVQLLMNWLFYVKLQAYRSIDCLFKDIHMPRNCHSSDSLLCIYICFYGSLRIFIFCLTNLCALYVIICKVTGILFDWFPRIYLFLWELKDIHILLTNFCVLYVLVWQFKDIHMPVGLGSLGVTFWLRDQRFAGSNPVEADGFFQDVKILRTSPPGGTLSWVFRVWDFRLVKEPQT